MASVLLVGPHSSARGGIAQFNAHLKTALQPQSRVREMVFSRLYPRWTRAGRAEIPSPGGTAERGSGLVAWRPWTWWRCGRLIRKDPPDVVVIQWWHPAFAPSTAYISLVARKAGARVVFVCHNAFPHERFPAARLLTRGALQRADSILTLSQETTSRLKGIIRGPNIQTLSHPAYRIALGPADPTEVRAAIGELDHPVILFFGYVRPYKGLEDLIRALPRLREKHPRATVLVAGEFYEPIENYSRLADELGVAEAVRLMPGYVEDQQVPGLLDVADVVALPYRAASQSGVLPQAVARGRRVVATNVGAIPDALDKSGVLAPPADPEALADALNRSLELPEPKPRYDDDGWDAWRDSILSTARAEPRSRPRRGLPALILKTLGWALVGYFMARVINDGLSALDRASVKFAALPAAASLLLNWVGRVADLFAWHTLLRGSGSRLPPSRSARIYATSELVRFLPGGALHLVARYRMGVKESVRPGAVVTALVLDVALRAATALAVFLITVPFWPSVPGGPGLYFILIPACLVGLHPRAIYGALRLLHKVVRRPSAEEVLPYTAVSKATFVYLIGWVIKSASIYLLYRAIVDLDAGLVLPIVGAFALSWLAGIAVPFAPAGLGVREASGASLLATIGAPVPALVMIAARVQFLLAELLAGLVVVAWDSVASRHKRGLEVPTVSPPGRGVRHR